MKSWIRVVLPKPIFLAIFVGGYVFLEVMFWCMVWNGRVRAIDWDLLHVPRDVLLFVAAIAQGAFRVVGFHPMYRPEYRATLWLTPWDGKKPLPAGPVQLIWQDVIVAGCLVGLALHHPHFSPLRIPLAFLAGYCGFLTVTFIPARLATHFYAMVFGIGLLVRVWSDEILALTVAVFLYAIGYCGLRLALKRLPEDAENYDHAPWFGSQHSAWLGVTKERNLELRRNQMLGWPFESLSPKGSQCRISYGHGVAISVLAGWWAYTLLAVVVDLSVSRESHSTRWWRLRIQWQTELSEHPVQTIRREISRRGEMARSCGLMDSSVCLLFVLAVVLSILRSSVYVKAHDPPISLWGRIRTLRWLIPAYDNVVVLAPICTIVVVCGFQFAMASWSLAAEIGLPVAVTLAFLINLNMGPRLTEWQTTCHCRITPTTAHKNKSEFVEV